MFRSPISPASFCTSARSSSRKAISSGDNADAVKTFVPGILIPNHHSSHAAKTRASAIRTKLSNNARTSLADLFAKEQRAKGEEQDRHDDENEQVRPVFEQLRAAKNDRAHERDEVGRGKNCAERIKNPRHRFARKDEAGKENTRQHEGHGDLQRLHLVFGFGRDEQAEAEQGEAVTQRRAQTRKPDAGAANL